MPSPNCLTSALKQEAARLGFDLSGVAPAARPPGIERFRRWLAEGNAAEMSYLADRADAYEHPRHVLDGVKSIIMLGVNYRTVEPAEAAPGQGVVSRYAWGGDYHDWIHERLHRLADFHRRLVPHARVRGVVDTAPLLEREFARLAGIGWIGKNTMLLNREFGSWIFLAALLTTEQLQADQPADDRCGTCRACLDACPSGALDEPYLLDAHRCISYLTIELRDVIPVDLRQAIGDRLFGCDLCQQVCPWNRRSPPTSQESFQPRAGMNPVELSELFGLDESAFRRRFRDTPLWRAKRRGLLRTAAVVLGSRPCESALPVLKRGLEDTEPLVRAACSGALGRFQQQAAHAALRGRLTVETDAEVRGEIESALGDT